MKILLPTDGSRYALTAARILAGWFARPGMEVDVLSVIPRMSKSPHRSYGQRKELAAQWKHEARGWLAQTAAPLESQGMRVRTHLRTGNPREAVVRWAEEGYDLVVVGARGRGDAPFFDVGSVALSVLEHAPAPVLMVRAPEGGRSRLPDALHPLRVLLAVDGGLPAHRALELLPKLLKTDHVQVTALAVADAGTGGPLPEATARHLAIRAAKELVDHGMEATPRLEAGPAAPAILETAEEADLVVLGSRAVERVEERHMGSVALEVARAAPCSVLILRHGFSGIEPAQSVEAPGRLIPFEIAYRNVEPSRTVERHVLKGMDTLASMASHAISCEVMVEQRNPRHRLGNLYQVRIDLSLPGDRVVVSRTPPEHQEHETLVTAINDAFQQLRRRLVDTQEVGQGKVKRHETTPRGVITDLFPDYGFLESRDGTIVYFHRNAVHHGEWDHLERGMEVEFTPSQGEKGPQASSVERVGRRHPVG